jgi:hypothetical protein
VSQSPPNSISDALELSRLAPSPRFSAGAGNGAVADVNNAVGGVAKAPPPTARPKRRRRSSVLTVICFLITAVSLVLALSLFEEAQAETLKLKEWRAKETALKQAHDRLAAENARAQAYLDRADSDTEFFLRLVREHLSRKTSDEIILGKPKK